MREMLPMMNYPTSASPNWMPIRMAFQGRKHWSTTTQKRELRNVVTLFNWLDSSELWPSPPRKWEKCYAPDVPQ